MSIRKRHLAAATLLIAMSPSLQADPTIAELTDIQFGELVPKSGYCELSPSDGSLTSPTNMCLGPAQLAHYRLTGDPNTDIRIRFNEIEDSSLGLFFQPTIYMENDLGTTQTWLFTNSYTTMSTGSDGLIDIYVGGRLTTSKGLNSLDSYQLSFEVDFEYAP